ncbi:hypothetical protein ACP4OV_022289 [Aristida adscensionis]
MVPTATTTTLSMKLLVDTQTQRVLFAEAGKDVVDFLFSLLALPAATAVKLVGKESMPGSTGSLYASVERLDLAYALPDAAALLRPIVASPAAAASAGGSLIFALPAPPPSLQPAKSFYRCGSSSTRPGCRAYVTDEYGRVCPNCGVPMAEPALYLPSAAESGQPAARAGERGFVQGVVTYTVMDDLTVKPMSGVSSIALLNALAVTDITALKERTVKLGYAEGLEILKASLRSKTVLTDVFILPSQ